MSRKTENVVCRASISIAILSLQPSSLFGLSTPILKAIKGTSSASFGKGRLQLLARLGDGRSHASVIVPQQEKLFRLRYDLGAVWKPPVLPAKWAHRR
jgi:hypothetical protein